MAFTLASPPPVEAMTRALFLKCVREASAKSILESDYWKFISANVSPYEGTKRYYATADIERLAIEGAGIDYTFSEKPSRAQKQPTPFSVWFARMKDTFKIAWYSEINSRSAEASILSSGFAGFQASEPAFFPLLFLTVSSQEFHAQKDLFCTGATQMSLTNEGLSRIQVPVPSEAAARKLGKQVLPLLNQMLVLQLRIQNLRQTRDLLLPRLLSGQINFTTQN
jgi:type I restriction enzyme S subunit